jgi:hypothetical protein
MTQMIHYAKDYILGAISERNAKILIAITILGFILRIIYLDDYMLQVDESTFLWWTKWWMPADQWIEHELSVRLSNFTHATPSLLLPRLLMQLWAGLTTLGLAIPFINPISAIRLPSVIAGTLSIPAIYILAEEIHSSNEVSLISALFLAVLPYHVLFSRRGWFQIQATLFTICGLILLYNGYGSYSHENTNKSAILCILGSSIMAVISFSFYSATVVLLMPIGLIVLFDQYPSPDRRILYMIIGLAPIGIYNYFYPLTEVVAEHNSQDIASATGFDIQERVQSSIDVLISIVGLDGQSQFIELFTIPMLLLAFVGIAYFYFEERPVEQKHIGTFAISYIIIMSFVFSRAYKPRFLLFTVPIFVLLSAYGTHKIANKLAKVETPHIGIIVSIFLIIYTIQSFFIPQPIGIGLHSEAGQTRYQNMNGATEPAIEYVENYSEHNPNATYSIVGVNSIRFHVMAEQPTIRYVATDQSPDLILHLEWSPGDIPACYTKENVSGFWEVYKRHC